MNRTNIIVSEISKFMEAAVEKANLLAYKRKLQPKLQIDMMREFFSKMNENRQVVLLKKQPAVWGIVACLVGGVSLGSASLFRILKTHPEVYVNRENFGEEKYWRKYTKLFRANNEDVPCLAPKY